jgi:hypothetical protein|tara:strand:+ start:1778 stop:2026 length:249 start_codon:yes stop_codon:yes gene_type:complete
MNSDRIKEIQEATAYPESVSVMSALKQVWNECAQEQVENLTIPIVTQRSEQFSLKQLWIMAQKYNQSDFVQMVTEVEKLNCG